MTRPGCSPARFACPLSVPLIALALLVSLVASAGGAPAQTPAFPAGVDLVRVDAVVLDRGGKPVRGLTAADFEVYENGKRRDVASFEAIDVQPQPGASGPAAPAGPDAESASRVLQPQEGRAVLVYFDDIHVQAENSSLVRRQLASFLARDLRSGDAITIVAPQQGLWWTARTPWEHAQLPSVIARLRGQYVPDPFGQHVADWAVMHAIEYGNVIPGTLGAVSGPAGGDQSFDLRGTPRPAISEIASDVSLHERYGLALVRIQRSLNGLQRAVDSLEGFRGRKSVIIYSEGFILSPALQDYDRLIDLCRRANVALYVTEPRGLMTGSDIQGSPLATAAGATALGNVPGTGGGVLPGTTLEGERAGSTYIAVATGGAAYQSNDTTEALSRVMVEQTDYYLIGFLPASGPPGERKLEVRVHGQGRHVRARNRYFVGVLPDPLKDPAADRVAREMSDRDGVAIRVSTQPGGETGKIGLRVTLEPVQPARERRVRILVERRPLAGGETIHDTTEITLPPEAGEQNVLSELRVPPGVWQAKVVVTDTATGATGSALHTFEVPTRTAPPSGDGAREGSGTTR